MSKYTPIDNESLLVERENLSQGIDYSFYDKHCMNLVDDNVAYSGNTPAELVKTMKARLSKINEEIDKLKLYKYIDIRNLSYWLKAKKLYWDRVDDVWEDPYENYFLKEKFILKDGTPVDAKNNIPGVFGQSWTTRGETDAMWRIYSKEDKTNGVNNTRIFYGVRIETTVRKLLDVIYVDDSSMANTWIGKVRYMTESEINQTLSGGVKGVNDALANSFFNKRIEFDHEKEFRAMTLLDSLTISKTCNYKRIAFDIADIEDFIESYVLDPRLSLDNYNLLREQLISLGVNPAKIKQSLLYHFEPIEVTISF